MSRFARPALALFALTLLAGCGGGRNQVTGHSQEDLGYSFDIGGCATGRLRFDSKAELCRGLQNRTLNRGCASEYREKYFVSQGCPGTFTEFDEAEPATVEDATDPISVPLDPPAGEPAAAPGVVRRPPPNRGRPLACEAFEGTRRLGTLYFSATSDLRHPLTETSLEPASGTARFLYTVLPDSSISALGHIYSVATGWTCAMGTANPTVHLDDGFTLECRKFGHRAADEQTVRITRAFDVSSATGTLRLEEERNGRIVRATTIAFERCR